VPTGLLVHNIFDKPDKKRKRSFQIFVGFIDQNMVWLLYFSEKLAPCSTARLGKNNIWTILKKKFSERPKTI